jgi:hypothetical protein
MENSSTAILRDSAPKDARKLGSRISCSRASASACEFFIGTLKPLRLSVLFLSQSPNFMQKSYGSFCSSYPLIPFEKPIPARQIGLVHRREYYKAELIKALKEAVLTCIPEEIRKIRRKDLEVLPI